MGFIAIIMNRKFLFLLITCCVFVWGQSWFLTHYTVVGVKIDCIPCLVLYCALFASWKELFFVCTLAGLLFDSMSLNPLGVTVISLLLPGYLLYCNRKVLLYHSVWVQALLGGAIGIIPPLLTLLQLTGLPVSPLINLGVLFVFIVLGITNAFAAPIILFGINYILEKYIEPLPIKYHSAKYKEQKKL